ncbi:MAG: LamB/YcsF family protein [Lachnospiraceae bacterium]|nr:LamB/YcsF family protein [Lachnospiraceae bacterium]
MGIRVDLNCDMGESFGNYKIGMDEDIVQYISSANIACGFHASDPLVMEKTIGLCRQAGVAPGAHPGFPDLVGFGRRQMKVTMPELKAMIIYQVGALKAFAEAEGLSLQHVKPHGAMYNMAGKDPQMADAICEGIASVDPDLILLGLSGSAFEGAAARAGLRFAREVFADRAYEEDGSLVARGKDGAMITDEQEAIRRVISMVKDHKVKAITGKEIAVSPDSICLHGDSPKAVLFAKMIREELTREGIEIAPIVQVIG